MSALPFMDQTSDIVTDTNPHFAQILEYTQHIRPMLVLPTRFEVKETTSTLKHEANAPCPLSSSWSNGWPPSSSEASTTVLTPKLSPPVESFLSTGNLGHDGADSSSTIARQKSRLSFPTENSSNGMRVITLAQKYCGNTSLTLCEQPVNFRESIDLSALRWTNAYVM